MCVGLSAAFMYLCLSVYAFVRFSIIYIKNSEAKVTKLDIHIN